MKNLFKTIMFVIMVSYLSVSLGTAAMHEDYNDKNYFQFSISNYHTTRQSGQVVNIYVKYAYKKGLSINDYPDYRLLRTKILKYMEPSEEFPADIFWEILATKMGKELMADFPVDGVSIQLYVLDNHNPGSTEPGDHGPIVTMGEITPLDVHMERNRGYFQEGTKFPSVPL